MPNISNINHTTTRYFTPVREHLESFRNHWGIENRLHWVLDVSFCEDGNRSRLGHEAEILGKLRRLAIGFMRKVQDKQTVPNMMFRAALSPDFRTKIIEQIIQKG